MVYIWLGESTGMVESDSIYPPAPYRYRTEIPCRLMLPDPPSALKMKGAPCRCSLMEDLVTKIIAVVELACLCDLLTKTC